MKSSLAKKMFRAITYGTLLSFVFLGVSSLSGPSFVFATTAGNISRTVWGSNISRPNLELSSKFSIVNLPPCDQVVDPNCGEVLPDPTISISVSPTSIISGDSATITWTVSDATRCNGSGAWHGSKSRNGGTESTGIIYNSGTYTYNLACSNGVGGNAGYAFDSVSLTVSPPPSPAVNFSPLSQTISAGQSASFNWSVSYANSCVATGDWSGYKAMSGSYSTGPLLALADPYIYTLTCRGSSGIRKSTTLVQVTSNLGTGASGGNISGFAWSDTIGWVSFNSSSDLAPYTYGVNMDIATGNLSGYAWSDNVGWISFNPGDVSSCPLGPCNPKVDLISGAATGWAKVLSQGDAWDGWLALSGAPSGNVAMNLATGAFSGFAWGGNDVPGVAGVIGWLDFSQVVGPAYPTVTISALPTTVAVGGSSALTWTSANVTSCNASGGWSGSKAIGGPNTQSTGPLSPAGTYTYTITCTGPGGSASAAATVVVTPVLLPDLTAAEPTPNSADDGDPQTYTSVISNIGNATTGASFSNFFQTASGPGGTGIIIDQTSSSMGALSSGAINTATSPSITFSAGTRSIRACADKSNSASPGVITESNETNNCSPWTNVTVTSAPTPVPVVSISASPATGAVNVVNPTVVWSASNNPTSCTASGDWTTGGTKPVSGSEAQGVLTQIKTYTYTMTCDNVNGTSAPASATVTTAAALPDLVALAPAPNTAIINVPTPYTSTISNIGNTPTGSQFGVIFQTADINGTGTITDRAPAFTMSPLASGASGTATSPAITFGVAGIYSIRACADKTSGGSTGTISESNEANNCSPWTNINVTAGGASATLSLGAANCTIALNASTCNVPFTWNIIGATTPNLFNATRSLEYSNRPTCGFLCPSSYPITFGVNIVQARDSATVLASVFPTASCVAGSSWNGSICAAGAPTVTLSANPTSVAPNGKSTLTWTSANATSCTASGGSTGWPTAVTGANYTGSSWLSAALPVGTYIYTLTCSKSGSPSAVATATVTSGVAVCGDGICQASETPLSCPTDCKTKIIEF